MRVFAETVPKALYDDMRRSRDIWQQEASIARTELSALMKEVIAFKRHDIGLPPAGFEPKDPTAILGPRTKAAIEEMSSGYSDLRSNITNWAILQAGVKGSDEEADAWIAHRIRMGDTE